MADTKISALTSATSLVGTEVVPVVQSATTKKVTAQIIADLASVKVAKVTVSSAQLLSTNTSPVSLLPAPGTGKMYDVVRVYFHYNFVTEYTSNTSLQVLQGDAGVTVTTAINFLGATDERIVRPTLTTTSYNQAIADVENVAILLFATGGNPAGGTSTIDVYLVYQILDIA